MADLSSLIKNDLAAAMNSHDINRVLQCFDDNATVNLKNPPPGMPNMFKGKSEIRMFFEQMIPGAHVEPTNFKTEGDRVEWSGRMTSDMLRNAGIDSVESKNTATIKNNKIVSFSPTMPPDVMEKLARAQQRSGNQPSGGKQKTR